jgi:glycosyltransferase involved in cell wall biosynthesis
LFLLPSNTESFGLAALEAMASGVPVISSNAGGIPELNKNGVSGFLRNVGDIKGMAKDAIKILESSESLIHFKEGAKRHSENFRSELVLPKYLVLYNKVLNGGN